MKYLEGSVHVCFDPPPADWREQLALRLGQRPRRIGLWAELALYGARACLDAAGLAELPGGAHLRIASLRGSISATQACLAQLQSGLPMPFSFLQSQPSQMLAALGQQLGWQGDARYVVSRDHAALLELARCEAGDGALLFGWVEEGDAPRSEWWWMPPG